MKFSKNIFFKRWLLSRFKDVVWWLRQDSIAKSTSSRTFTSPAVMASERETCTYEKRCAILKLWFPSKLLTQWIHQAKLWPLWDIAASKVSVSCFLCFAEDSQSYCNLQSCRPGPSTGTLCGYFVLWWFCKKYQGKSIICGGRADSLTLPMDSRAPKSTGQHI